MEVTTLALDMSTTCTGYALFKGKELITHGIVKPKVKGITKMVYPEKPLRKIQSICGMLQELIQNLNPDRIVIEEVNAHKNRLSGKTLDGLHYVFLTYLDDETLKKIRYMDSDGSKGWRTRLKLKMSAGDREVNKERKKLNKKIARGTAKLPIINKKHLACRYVNSKFGTNFDVDLNTYDNDVVDAIGLGWAFINYMWS